MNKTLPSPCRRNRGWDKLVSSPSKIMLVSLYYHKGKFTGLISETPLRTKQERVNSFISMAALWIISKLGRWRATQGYKCPICTKSTFVYANLILVYCFFFIVIIKM